MMRYSVRLSIIISAITFAFSAKQASAQLITPPDLAGLTLWLRADSGVTTNNSGGVTSWQDVSGSGHSTTGPVRSDSLPTLLTHVPLLANHPSINFNGLKNMFYGGQINGLNTSSLTIFIVSKNNGESGSNYTDGLFTIGPRATGMWVYGISYAGTEAFAFSNNYGTTNSYIAAPNSMPDAGTPYTIWGVNKNFGTSVAIYENGVSLASSTGSVITGSFTNANYFIGNTFLINGFENLHGEIAEIIIYNTSLSDSQQQSVENYIYNKYAPPVSLGSDINNTYSLCPDTLNAGTGYVSYLWSDGEVSSEIAVSKSGTYSVTVTDVFGHTSSDTINVTYPNANLQLTDTTICVGSAVTVATELANTSQYTFLWNTGATTATISASTGGKYSVKVKDNSGCTVQSSTMTLVVDSLSDKTSIGTDTNLCNGNSISLVSPASGWNTFSFHWSTGSTDSLATITTTGQYSVSVTDAIGCTASATLAVTVNKPGTAPDVNFAGDTLCFGVPYVPLNLTTPTNNINAWQWSFGDGDSSTLSNASHLYAHPGYYIVSLSALNSNGCFNSIRKTVTVHQNPSAVFNGGPGCTSNSYQFNDLSIAYMGDSVITWNWNFGDGSHAVIPSPSHQYDTAGSYKVILAVTDNEGCAGNVSKNISIGGAANLVPVSLTIPGNGAVFTDTSNIVFSWNSVQSASSYSLEISTDSYFDNPIVYSNLTVNQVIVNNLQSQTTYYWMVTSYNICNDSAESVVDSFSFFSPSELSSCITLWLRGDSVKQIGDSISKWYDLSGHGYNTVGPMALDSQPTVITHVPLLNNKPSVNFNGGTNEFYGVQIPGIGQSSLTTFILSKNNGEPTGQGSYTDGLFTINNRDQGMWIYGRLQTADYTFINNYDAGAGAISSAGSNTMPVSGYPYTIWGMQKNYGNQVALYTNGMLDTASVSTNSNITGPFTNAPYLIGNTSYGGLSGFHNLNGEIAEIIIFSCALSDAEQQEVNNYLYTKYAPPVYLGPDIVQNYRLCADTLKAGNRFVSYLWNTGDTTSQLVVNQSGTYSVSVIDVFGRSSSDTINVKLPYLGSIPASDTIICIGTSVTLTQQLSNGGTYYFHWNTGGSADTMTVNAPGDYIATITDTTGCKTVSDTVHVSLDSFSLVQLVAPDTLICGNSAVTLNDTAFHPVSYFWSPGGDTSALFRIDTNGLYSVTVTDINGCEAHGSVQVTTHGASPTANFGVSSLCLGTNTMFTDQSQPVLPDAIDSFYWQLSGGTPSFATVANPITTYHAFGNYSVTVHLVTDSGCTAAVTKVITIYPRPNTSFNYQGSNSSQELASIICAGTYVNFTDTSIAVGGAALTSRLWEFNGIPDSNTDAHILYDFPVEGDYTATLIVTNADGCSDTLTQPIEVFPALTANFADSGTCGADTTRFIDLTNSFSVVSWLWTFGDGTTSANENPVHYYGGSGANLVTLTVENAIGCISTISKNVSVFQNPVAGFSATTGCENHYYTPEDNTLTFGDPVVSWNWTIAGSRFISQAPEYLFTDTGNYPVTLAVTTQNGCYDSTAQNITIKTNPVAEFAYTPLYGSAPVNVNFINLSTGAEHYIWNFGDSSYSTEENPEHTFTEDTIFNVVLVAINTYGCADTITRQYITQPTNLCLEVTGVASIQTPQADGTVLVQVVVQLVNFGTRIVTSAEIKATLGSGGVLVQEWTGNLITGQIILDTIPAQFDVSPASANTYVCVSVSNVNNGQIETNCSSNEYCSSLTGTMQLAGPSPNPAANQSILGIILPQAGQVYIAVYDAMGNPVMNEQVFNMPAGITDFPLPVQQWGAGTYFIRVRYNYDTEVRKIIVL